MAIGGHTGYVHSMLDEGQDFPTFVWSVARSFGAFVMLRDYSPDEKPTPLEFSVEPYYIESVAKAESAKAEWAAMTDAQRIAWAVSYRDGQVEDLQKSLAESLDQGEKVAAMVAQVEAWKPPTKDHQGLKADMLRQLGESNKYGPPGGFERKRIAELEAKSLEDMARERGEEIDRSLARAKTSLAEEEERVAGRNRWIAALNASIPMPRALLDKVGGEDR